MNSHGKYSAKAVANSIIDAALEKNIELTPMKIQKLVFYCHAWYMAFFKTPLIKDEIQAWRYGPVIPELYYEFKDAGDESITKKATDLVFSETGDFSDSINLITPDVPLEDIDTWRILNESMRVYGKFTAIQLSNLTHMPGEPWAVIAKKYQSELPNGLEIPNELIRSIFEARLPEKLDS
jgi:uncharacterized phage-associated protein